MKAWRFMFSGGTVAAAVQTFGARLIILAMNLATGILTANLLGAEGRGEQGAMAIWPSVLMPILIVGLPMSLVYNSGKSKRFAADYLLRRDRHSAGARHRRRHRRGPGDAADPDRLQRRTWYLGAQGLVLMLPLTLCNTLVYSVYESRGEFG